MLRKLVVLFVLTSLTFGLAQHHLTAPNYYLSQLEKLELGSTIAGELTTGAGQNFKDGSYLNLYVLPGEAGQSVGVRVESDDFDAYLSLFAPDGSLLAENDDSEDAYGYSLNPFVSVTLPSDGAYLVVVSGYSNYDTGAYTVNVTELSANTVETTLPGVVTGTLLSDSAPLPLRPDLTGQEVVFQLDQSGLVLIDLSSEAFDAQLLVFDDNGVLVGQNDDRDYSEATDYDTDSQLLLPLSAGNYSIYVTSWFASSSGDYTLQLRLLEELR